MSELTCPKCHGTMRQYERSGVTVDQCTDCRGIFLDRGELERLADAETRWHDGQRPAPPTPASAPGYERDRHSYGTDHGYDRRRHDDDDDDHGFGYGRGPHSKKRKRSFLDDLFD